MSLLGFDAVGRWALGSLPDDAQAVTLAASPGAFAATGSSALFTIREAVAPGSFAWTGVAGLFKVKWSVAAGAFTFNGQAATFRTFEQASTGAFGLTGLPINVSILFPNAPGAIVIAGQNADLVRTGDDYEFKLGGVGHYLEEIERQKQLNAITRRIPAPVDRRTIPRFAPLPAVQPMPAAPVVDMAAPQRQADAARAAVRRRRDEEAVLLLAC